MQLRPNPVLPSLPPHEYEQLKEQITLNGVETPILITPDYVIIDGHERYKIAQELNLKKFPVRLLGKMTEAERVEKAVRLNVHRRHLNAAERRRLLATIIKAAPHKSSRDLADTCKVSHATAARMKLKVLGVSDETPTIGRDGKIYKKPKPAVSCENAQRVYEAGQLLQELGDHAPTGGVTLRTLRHMAHERRTLDEASGPVAMLPTNIQVEHCDFRHLEQHVGDLTGRVDVILSDPPWKEQYVNIRRSFAEFAARVLKPGGACCFYCGQAAVPGFLASFDGVLTYRWLGAALNNVNRRPLRVSGNIETGFRPLLIFSKGSMKLPKTLQDVLRCDDLIEPRHPLRWDQPFAEVVRLLESLSRPGSLVVDPFAGSGTVPAAVATLGQGRRAICCDTSALCIRIARKRVLEVMDESVSGAMAASV